MSSTDVDKEVGVTYSEPNLTEIQMPALYIKLPSLCRNSSAVVAGDRQSMNGGF